MSRNRPIEDVAVEIVVAAIAPFTSDVWIGERGRAALHQVQILLLEDRRRTEIQAVARLNLGVMLGSRN